MNATSAEILKLLSLQEESIASLYAAFSTRLPQMGPFWNHLVKQEKAHRDVLMQLAAMAESGKLRIDTKRFNPAAVRTNIGSLEWHRAMALSDGVTAIRALAIASDTEHSLIEAGYFQIVLKDNPAIEKEIEDIESHTKQHIMLVDSHLAEERKASSGGTT